jgi:hypothetical protein
MSLTVKQPSQELQSRPLRRIWHAPASKTKWFWLAAGLLFYIALYVWFIIAARAQGEAAPINDPFRLFGITAYILVLSTAAYSLRRRFVRGLPGKVQGWLWMHTWIGVLTILIAFLHENYLFVLNGFAHSITDLTETYWAGAALFALLFLVLSGVTGRLLDLWQTRLIAHEASTNGVGIVRALEERILEIEYTIERLCAGKSESFKAYCLQALSSAGEKTRPPLIAPNELPDFQRACETFSRRAILVQSLARQRRARRIISTWRTVHITLACIALVVISYHSGMELLTNVFHILPAQ